MRRALLIVLHIAALLALAAPLPSQTDDTPEPTPLRIDTTALPMAVAEASYSHVLSGSGGVEPYAWSLADQPVWLNIDASSGQLQATPPAGAAEDSPYTFCVRVQDCAETSVSRSLELTVAPASNTPMGAEARIVFLHHSTGGCIYRGGVPAWFAAYNTAHERQYQLTARSFPAARPYGWHNYPFDYWNIWVNHAGTEPYMEEPTLEILTRSYDVIVLKHCFPVSAIQADTGTPDITSSRRSIENYQVQYLALKQTMRTFPAQRFIVWTGAALTEGSTGEETARRADQFFDWVVNTWDEPGDNIFVWDFFELETEGGVYLLSEHARSATDSHPNDTFSTAVAPLFCQRVVDVVEGRGDTGSVTGR